VADAVERRLLLVVSSAVGWACTVGLLLQALVSGGRETGAADGSGGGGGNLVLILVLVAVQSGAFAVTSSVRGAIVPRVLPVEIVPAGNTLEFTASNLASVVGPLVAGIVLARWSYSAAYAVDALLFTFALYAAARLPRLEPQGQTQSPGLRSVIDGLAFIATKPVLGLSFAVDIAAMLAMPRALFPAAAERFGGGAAIGWLYASISIGSVLAGLSGGWIGRVRRQGVALVLAVVVWGLAVGLSGLAGNLALAVVLLAAAGAADLVSAVYRQTILQTYAPDEMRGRLQGVFIVVVTGGPRLGDLRAGSTATWAGTTASWAGGGFVCAAVVLFALLNKRLRHYDAAENAPPTPS
jgi:MFS family permease